jgi:hypothetical protein
MIELRLRPAVATDQDRSAEDAGMVAGEHQGDLRADAAAEHDRARGDALVGQHGQNVAAHVVETERRARLGGAAPAAQVHRNGAESRRKALHLIEPEVVVERQRVHEHERRPLPRRLVEDVEAVGPAHRHAMVLIAP